jgi:hypothetical protein
MNYQKFCTLAFLFSIIISNCDAQQTKSNKKIKFHSINTVGLLEGQAGSTFQLQTINGFKKKSWFAGLGVGLDYYRLRTIPLFADVRKEFGKKENKFFLYADGGINFYWLRDKDAKQFYVDDKFKSGFYGEAGFGYKFILNQKLAMTLNGGYSYKKLTEVGNNYFFYYGTGMINPPYPMSKIVYNLNRIVLKIGIEF